ncbi:MAG: hypothetical protein HY319_09565 [Armatimonadetes bacterium]|nr:hypothetical protein [Armatimonadota bacterium]
MDVTLARFRELALQERLHSRTVYLRSLDLAVAALRGRTGIAELRSDRPCVVVPDLHARRDFLLRVLEHRLEERSLLELLSVGRVNLLCLGDGMHSEERGRARWERAASLSLPGLIPASALDVLDQEMVESLGLMQMVMELKHFFPEHFHYLKGNHDQVMGHVTKFAPVVGEGRLVRAWIRDRFGEDFLQRYKLFEDLLPLMAIGRHLVATHSAPGRAVSKNEIELRTLRAEKALCWTSNSRRARDGSYLFETEENYRNFKEILRSLGRSGSTWIIGHRAVDSDENGGLYRSQFKGRMIQINRPDRYVIAVIPADGRFRPELDVYDLERTDHLDRMAGLFGDHWA